MPVPEEDLTRETPAESPDTMPDWLHAADEQEQEAAKPDIPTEMPDWLREVPAKEAPPQKEPVSLETGLAAAQPPEQADVTGEPVAEDLEAPTPEMPVIADVFDLPTRAELPAVETPDWLADLRKGEGASVSAEEDLPVETSGPLAGLRGVLNPEPLLAILPRSTYKPAVPIPDEHRAEVDLIKDVLEPVAPSMPKASPGRQVMAGLGRWLVYLALAVVVFVAPIREVVLPVDLVETKSFANAINGLPEGSTVLLVIDYDASLDGELTPQMRAIIWHLLQRNLGIVTVSLSPQGSAIAQDLFRERGIADEGRAYVNLGYLPPHPASVQAFTDSPFGGVTLWATTPNAGQTALGQQVRSFDDLDLIVTVSGDRDHVRWWIEQVWSQKRIDIVAAVSASVAPYIQPYYDEKGRGPIKGMLVGLAAVPQYERLTGIGVNPSAWANYIVQVNAQLLLVAVVLLAAVGSLFKNLPRGMPGRARPEEPAPVAEDGGE
jgi:hypothetical protein